MSGYLLLKLAHVLAVIAMLSGVIGRGLVRLRIQQITSIQVLQEFIVMVGRFDDWLVIRGGGLTVVTGLLLGWVGDWPYFVASHPTWICLSLLLFLSQQPFVFLVFVPRGKQFGKMFQVALAEQRITPELRATIAEPAVRVATTYEVVTFALILGLMVLKPF